MPRVLNYTPSWLSRPSPGFDIFSSKTEVAATNGTRSGQGLTGPLKTIAHRASEVFVASGKEIRWTDLVMLKEKDAEKTTRFGPPSQDEDDSSYVVRSPPTTFGRSYADCS